MESLPVHRSAQHEGEAAQGGETGFTVAGPSQNTLREGRAVWLWLDLIGEQCLRLEIAKILLASEFKYMLAGAECH